MHQNSEEQDFFLFYVKDKKKFFECTDLTSGHLYFKNYRIDLMTGEKSQVDANAGIDHLEECLASIPIDKYFKTPKIISLFYDYSLKQIDKLPSDKPLALIADFSKVREFTLQASAGLNQVELAELSTIEFNEYSQMFDQVEEHLKKGNCYQINLTALIRKKVQSSAKINSFRELCHYFFSRVPMVSPYAHAMSFKHWGEAYLSNSPECLFQKYQNKNNEIGLYTMPIKGTIESGKKPLSAFQKLLASKKDRAELYMISDLMRNDLTKVCLQPAKVIKSRAMLEVPGLVHQYSLLSTKVFPKTSLLKIIHCLFPGGSITGAPKKKVIELIHEIEREPRGYYCSSTLFCFREHISASINIRSVTFKKSESELIYGSGGGITLKSIKYDEYNELLQKILSFFSYF